MARLVRLDLVDVHQVFDESSSPVAYYLLYGAALLNFVPDWIFLP